MYKYSYYPGNAARQSCLHAEDTIQPMSSSLGIQLIEMPGYSSDGGDVIKQSNKFLQLVRTLAILRLQKRMVMTSLLLVPQHTETCQMRFHRLQFDAGLLAEVNTTLGKTTGKIFSGEIQTPSSLACTRGRDGWIGYNQVQGDKSSGHESCRILWFNDAKRRFLRQ